MYRRSGRHYLLNVLVGGTLALMIWSAPGVGMAQENAVSVSGIVRDPSGQPIDGATIRVYRAGNAEVARTRTRANGTYAVTVPAGSPIAMVEYDHREWHVRAVEQLSGRAGENDTINILLLKKRGPETFGAIVDQILVYDRLRIIYQFRDGAPPLTAQQLRQQQAELRERYGDRILNIPHPARFNDFGPGAPQKNVINRLTADQREVINRLMQNLLFRYGYVQQPASG